jgi:hypothetical protein
MKLPPPPGLAIAEPLEPVWKLALENEPVDLPLHFKSAALPDTQ